MARDMTMERNLRTALVESRQRYKDLVEVSSDFSWETNVNGEFIFVSPKGALGYQAEELINKKAEEFVISPEEFSPLPFVSLKSLGDVKIWMRNKDDSIACVILSCVPLVGEENGEQQWKGSRGICRNVTEERENESALARALGVTGRRILIPGTNLWCTGPSFPAGRRPNWRGLSLITCWKPCGYVKTLSRTFSTKSARWWIKGLRMKGRRVARKKKPLPPRHWKR